MKKITLLMATVIGVFATPMLWAQMNHGDMGGMGNMPGMGHGANTQPEPTPALPSPVQAVFDSYIKIQTALAQDSMQDVSANATTIAVTVQAVSAQTLPPAVAQEAKVLAKANDLKAARDAFKPLSDSLVNYLDANKIHARHFAKVHCSMANADWLQTDSTVNNPYLGKEMAHCGQFVTGSSNEKSGQQDNSMPGMKM